MTPREIARVERKLQDMKIFPFSGPRLDEGFYVFAIRVCSEGSTGKRKLIPGKFYYLLDGFSVEGDNVYVDEYRYRLPVFDYYQEQAIKSPHVSFSAIVGENGSGKSSLVEFELRLINNFSAAVFGEYSKEPGWEHLHFIKGVDGELYYLWKKTVYCLKVQGRNVSLFAFRREEGAGPQSKRFLFVKDNPPMSLLPAIREPDGVPIHGVFSGEEDYYSKLKDLLPRFFYTVVLNQSVYAYNTSDFRRERNGENYEQEVRRGRKLDKDGNEVDYSVEDTCWLNGLFHKNDGYQIPLVLSPFRKHGNYDINTENTLAYERLISQMVLAEDEDRIINGHLKVNSFKLSLKERDYDLQEIRRNLGYSQFIERDFASMKKALLRVWSDQIHFKLYTVINLRQHGSKALNYLVYKTLKIAATYDEYRDFRNKYLVEHAPYDDAEFSKLVEKTIANYSHVSRKLYRTVAYLIWEVYEKHGGKYVPYSLNEIKAQMTFAKDSHIIDVQSRVGAELLEEASIPPPFFDLSIGLWDINSGEGDVRFEYLSSGEKQQAYTTSSLIYHLKNLDSVKEDGSTIERVSYESVQIILEEVELYYHPELQRTFVRNLLDGILRARLQNIKWISIQIVTHSPFVLSDIPSYNVLALKKDNTEVGRIPCFGGNIHEMLKQSFFLQNGTVGDFAKWMTVRISQCLRVSRWINKLEALPPFLPTLEGLPEEYDWMRNFRAYDKGHLFNPEAFVLVYSPEVLLSQINLIEEPVVRRVLLDDYRRTFPDKKEEYKESMRALLQTQMDALEKL